MRIRLLVKFSARAGQGDRLVNLLQGAKSELLKVPGCESVELLQSLEQPDSVVLSEIWKSRQIHDEYAARMVESGSMDQLAPLLTGAPETELYRLQCDLIY